MKEDVVREARQKMDKAIESFAHELSTLRTGRATPAIFDHVKVDYYGTMTPIRQVATFSVPEPRLITIQPFDPSQTQKIEKAILSSDLGLTPSSDGKVIRISLPPLTEERRRDLVKVARKYAEECKVAVRNVRRDSNEALKKLEKDKKMSQDELKKAQDEVQHLTDGHAKKVDEVLKKKEDEIMEV